MRPAAQSTVGLTLHLASELINDISQRHGPNSTCASDKHLPWFENKRHNFETTTQQTRSKSAGTDKITNEVLKCLLSWWSPLQDMFNTILRSAEYPTKWAESIIQPTYKWGNKDNCGNYRGSLISCIGKLSPAMHAIGLTYGEPQPTCSLMNSLVFGRAGVSLTPYLCYTP